MNKEERRKYMQKYQQSDAFKKYRQSDAFKKYQDARRRINTLLQHYQNNLSKTQKELRHYAIPPIPLQGKEVMEREIIDNLEIIRQHTLNLDSKIKPEAINTMIDKLLSQEGILVSRRRKLASTPIHSPDSRVGVSLGAE